MEDQLSPAASAQPVIRPAEPGDAGAVHQFIVALAETEEYPGEVSARPADVAEALFGPRPVAEAVMATIGGQPAGFALFYLTYSTVLGQPALHLEDLYVRPEHRGSGLGRSLLAHLAGLAVRRGCGRLDWQVLRTNEPALRFYRRLRARELDEITTFRLEGAALRDLARDDLARDDLARDDKGPRRQGTATTRTATTRTATTDDQIEVRRGSAADIPLLEPLWVSVHHRHAEAMPELAPYVDDARTWAERSALYAELLAKPDTVLLLAMLGGEVAGYGLSQVMPAAQTWVADTWQTGDRIGEIESLAVLPAYRGQGIGTRLLDELERELDAMGVRDLVIGVLPGNAAAIRLYQRRGFRPTWSYLSRLAGR